MNLTKLSYSELNSKGVLAAMMLACFVLGASVVAVAADGVAGKQDTGIGMGSSLFVEVRLDSPLKLSSLKAGGVVNGELSRRVYSGDREIFPVGSHIQLTVGKPQCGRWERNNHRPWLAKLFASRHESYPCFQSAIVTLPCGTETPLRVSLVSVSRRVKVYAQAKRSVQHFPSTMTQPQEASRTHPQDLTPNKVDQRRVSHVGPTMLFEAVSLTAGELATAASAETHSALTPMPGPVMLPAGTQAQLILLNTLRASTNRSGDSFLARLLEPVCLGARVVLPEGSLFEGQVVKSTPPRRLSRQGSLYLTFTRVVLPSGSSAAIVASITGLDVSESSHIKVNSEGELSGGTRGKARFLIDLAITGGIAKMSDDSLQLLVEAVVSTATDASTAGIARIISASTAGLFLLTRHGRDVVLPKFTEIDIMLNRPPSPFEHESPPSAQLRPLRP